MTAVSRPAANEYQKKAGFPAEYAMGLFNYWLENLQLLETQIYGCLWLRIKNYKAKVFTLILNLVFFIEKKRP